MPGPGIEVFIGGNPAKLKAALAEAKREVDGFAGSSKKSLESIEKFAVPAAAAFAGIAVGIGASVKAFGDFEASLNQIKAVSGATAQQMAQLKAQALQLGKDTQFSAKQAADAMGELAKAGFTVEQTMTAMPGVLSLAAAGGLGVAQAAEAAGEALNAFGLGADQAQKVADLLAQAANASAVSVQDLSESFKFVAPVAASTSQSIEEVSTMLAVMGNAGIKGSQGGTAMRAALAALVRPSDDAANRLHTLGISIQDTSGKMLPLSDIIGQLRDKTGKLSEVQRASAIATIFGTEAMSGILAVMKQTPAQVEAVAKQFRNVEGAAADMAKTMNGGFKGAMEQLSGSVETLGTTMGEAFAPVILKVAGGIKAIVDAVTALDPSVKAMLAGAVAGTAALLAFAAAAGAISAAIPLVTAGVAALGVAAGPVGIAIVGLAATIGIATAAMAKSQDQSEKSAKSMEREAGSVNALVAEYDKLQAKTKLTADEKKRMQEIIDSLEKISPDLVKAYNAQGRATDIEREAVEKLNEETRERLRLAKLAANEARENAVSTRDGLRMELYAAERELETLEKAIAGERARRNSVAGLPAEDRRAVEASVAGNLANLERMRATQRASIASIAEALRIAHNEVNRITSMPVPKASGGIGGGSPGRDRGTPVNASGNGNKSSEAEQELRDIEAIAEAYQEAADGKARNAQLAANAAVMAFDKEMEAELDAISEALEADEEFTRKKIENSKLSAREAARIGEELINQKFGKAVKDVQGDITAIAIDPSLERLANFAKGLADDEAKIQNYADAIGHIGNEFDLAGGGAKGFGAAIGAIASNINPVSIALTVVAGLAVKIATSFQEAAEAQRRSLDMIREMQGQIMDADIALEDDPIKKAILIRNKAISDGQDEFNKVLAERRKALFDQSIAFVNNSNASTTEKGQRISDLDRQFKAGTGIFSEDALASTDEVVGTAKTLFEKIKKQAEKTFSKIGGGTIGGFLLDFQLKLAAQMAAEVEQAMDVIEKQDEAQRELDAGGRNDRGEKISLELERQLALDKQRKANQDTLNGLTERKLKLERELSDLQTDMAERIAAIQNEGIAVRAKTEFQDKSERIAKVKEDADARRKDLVENIADLETDIKDAQVEAGNAIARINNQYDERISRLTDEIGKQQVILDLLNQQAVAAAKAARDAERAAAASKSGKSSKGSTFLGYADATSVRKALAGMSGAATGGMVAGGIQGKDSVPMLTMPGELIVDNQTTKGLQAMIQYVMGARTSGGPMPAMAGAGGGNVHIGGITIVAAPGMDENRLVRKVTQEIGRQIRRTGL